jgi:hypothetical protein
MMARGKGESRINPSLLGGTYPSIVYANVSEEFNQPDVKGRDNQLNH